MCGMDHDRTDAAEAERRLDTKEAITLALHYTRMVTEGEIGNDTISSEEAHAAAQVYAILALARAIEGLSSRPSM